MNSLSVACFVSPLGAYCWNLCIQDATIYVRSIYNLLVGCSITHYVEKLYSKQMFRVTFSQPQQVYALLVIGGGAQFVA